MGNKFVIPPIENLTDVVVKNPSDGQTLVYRAATKTWVNATVGSGTGGVIEYAVYDNGSSGTTAAINLDNGNLQEILITGAVAITLTTPTKPGKMTLIVTQDGSGHVYSISGVKWQGGTTPSYSTALNKVDVVSLIYDGSSWYGMLGAAFA